MAMPILWIIAGLVLLVVGGELLVRGASRLAAVAGISPLVIGLTVVAFGTSAPELAVSLRASWDGRTETAVGNVVGSSIFNVSCVLGLSAAVVPGGVEVSDTALWLDSPVMLAVAIACLPIFFTGHVIARWEGGVFFGYYLAYTTYLVLSATSPSVSRTFGVMMLTFVVPLTVLTLIVGVVLRFMSSRRPASPRAPR